MVSLCFWGLALLRFEEIGKSTFSGYLSFIVSYVIQYIFLFRYNGYDNPPASIEQQSAAHSRPPSSQVRSSPAHRNSPRQKHRDSPRLKSAQAERYSAVSNKGLLGEEEKVDLRETDVSWIFIPQ